MKADLCVFPFFVSQAGSELCPLNPLPGGGHKCKRNKESCSLLLCPDGWYRGERNNDELWELTRGSCVMTFNHYVS